MFRYHLLRLLFGCVVQLAVVNSEYRVHTAYACEGDTLSLACGPESEIRVVRANFGRFSISVCNSQGWTNISTHCPSPTTTERLDKM
jgi:hypothetical protein